MLHPIVTMLDEDIDAHGQIHRHLCRQKGCIEYAAGPRFFDLRDEIERVRVILIAKQKTRITIARVLRCGDDPAALIDDAMRILAESAPPLPRWWSMVEALGEERAVDVWRAHHRHHRQDPGF